MKSFHDPTKLQKIQRKLCKLGETLAVAESVTTGLLQVAFGSTPCASEFFQGGITTYNVGQKYKHLEVEPIHALSVNCVSMTVAEQMALQCSHIFTSDWGLAVTGYATPVAESGNKLYAFVAIAYKHKIVFSKKIDANVDDPFDVQLLYATSIIDSYLKLLSSASK